MKHHQQHNNSSVSSPQHHLVQQCLDHLLQHPQCISAPSLSRQLNIPKKQLSVIARQLYNISLNSFLHSVKMKLAMQLLRHNNKKIWAIASELGYAQLGHFSAAFKKHYGCTPSLVQKQVANAMLFDDRLVYLSAREVTRLNHEWQTTNN